MSHWNHRVVKKTYENDTEEYSVRETFYNDDGSIMSYTEDPADVVAETMDGLRQYLEWCLKSLDDPILIDGEVEFVDDVDYSDESQWVELEEGFFSALDEE